MYFLSQLKQQEELGEGLHLIDFEQLKIENSTLHDQLEERADQLHKLRKKTITTVQVLTHVKEKLQFVQQQHAKLLSNLEENSTDLAQLRDTVTQNKHARDRLRHENSKLKLRQGFIGSDMLVTDFELRKVDLLTLSQEVNTLKREHEKLSQFVMESNREINRLKQLRGGAGASLGGVGGLASAAQAFGFGIGMRSSNGLPPIRSPGMNR